MIVQRNRKAWQATTLTTVTDLIDFSQKQPPKEFCKKQCSKTPVLESLFNKVAGQTSFEEHLRLTASILLWL